MSFGRTPISIEDTENSSRWSMLIGGRKASATALVSFQSRFHDFDFCSFVATMFKEDVELDGPMCVLQSRVTTRHSSSSRD